MCSGYVLMIRLTLGKCHRKTGYMQNSGCTTGEVRLVGDANNAEGRVEICLSDEWGTVCDQMWDVTRCGM